MLSSKTCTRAWVAASRSLQLPRLSAGLSDGLLLFSPLR
jgi:hypothetical protein